MPKHLSKVAIQKHCKETMAFTSPFLYVDSEETLASALADLGGQAGYVFDSEGVNLGRSGSLTIATISGLQKDNHLCCRCSSSGWRESLFEDIAEPKADSGEGVA